MKEIIVTFRMAVQVGEADYISKSIAGKFTAESKIQDVYDWMKRSGVPESYQNISLVTFSEIVE